jgi:hypothetical protein
MATKDVVLLILGALSGVVATAVYNSSKEAISNRVRKMLVGRRAKRASTGLVAKERSPTTPSTVREESCTFRRQSVHVLQWRP